MDLYSTLPNFPTAPYVHILPLLERAGITVKELLHFDPLQIAKRARAPVTDIRNLIDHIVNALQRDLGLHRNGTEEDNEPERSCISTLDSVLDDALGGGISTGYVTEITGESGCGKTQFLLHLLLAVQLPQPRGLAKRAIYISTESDLSTTRLSQLLESHEALQNQPPGTPKPSLEHILAVTAVDLETQDYVLNFQLPVAVQRYDVGLVVIDSITANYRAEMFAGDVPGLLQRSWELKKIGHILRSLAMKYNIAIVVANQVSDRIAGSGDDLLSVIGEGPRDSLLDGLLEIPDSALTSNSQSPRDPASSSHGFSAPTPLVGSSQGDSAVSCAIPSHHTLLSLEYQQPFYTGCDNPTAGFKSSRKVPALGLVWTNQIDCRIVLRSEEPVHHFSPADYLEQGGLKQEIDGGEENGALQQVLSTAVARSETVTESPIPPSTSSAPYRGRRRQMQVVFSPWTSGSLYREGNGSQFKDCDVVEFEVLPHGICGVTKPSSRI